MHDMGELFNLCGKDVECNYWEQECKGCEHYDSTVVESNSYFLWKVKKEIQSFSRLKKIVCPSEWLKKKVEKTYLKNIDMVLIHNGIDVQIFKNYDKNKARDKLGLPRRKIILMFMAFGGINNKEKGGHYISRIYEKLRTRGDLFFLIIGGEKNRSYGNWKEVSYTNDSNLIALYYSAADLFIYPTLLDVFGLVVVESISCGTPVITFNTGGVPELVEHMKTGYIAEHGNIDDLIYGMELFINNIDLRKKVNHIGHELIEKQFSLEQMTKNYIKVYEEVLSYSGN
jgi:glycosyltransferase involved in cell wall biosynthesis